MAFKVITPVATEPVSLVEARLQIKLTDSDSTAEDGLIGVWITTAREIAEHYTGRALAPQTLEMALDFFPGQQFLPDLSWAGQLNQLGPSLSLPRDPDWQAISLDRPPVTAITSIKYIDLDGVEQTLAAGQYYLTSYGDARLITLTYGNSWPSARRQRDAVKVLYAAGYATCPKAAKAAILLIIGHLYEHRQDVIVDVRAAALEIPRGAQSLLDSIKIWGR